MTIYSNSCTQKNSRGNILRLHDIPNLFQRHTLEKTSVRAAVAQELA